MKVDPAGLASAAQRISAALAQLPSGDGVHLALAQEPVAKGAAARLARAGLTLAALITAQGGVFGGHGRGARGQESATITNETPRTTTM